MAYLDYDGLQHYHNGMKQYVQLTVDNAINHFINTLYHVCASDEYDSTTYVPTFRGEKGVIYLVPKPLNQTEIGDESIVGSAVVGTASVAIMKNVYYEYIYNIDSFEMIGDVKVDLTGYLKDTDIATNTDVTNMLNELSL